MDFEGIRKVLEKSKNYKNHRLRDAMTDFGNYFFDLRPVNSCYLAVKCP